MAPRIVETMISLFSLHEYLMLAMSAVAKSNREETQCSKSEWSKVGGVFPWATENQLLIMGSRAVLRVQSSTAVKGAYKRK